MFNKKTWKDNISQYPNRRTLQDVSTGATQTVTVTRNVGTVSQQGDAWNAQNMNDLEQRISDAFALWNWKGVITSAQYKALSENEKLTGVYGIKD